MKRIDLSGMTFGSLRVLKFSGINKYNRALWLCECKCGKNKLIESSALRNGLIKSCGCERKYHGMKDISNMEFSNLKILGFSHYQNGYAFWKCLCKCGRECILNGRYLRNGDTKSCGCLKKLRNITHGKSNTKIFWIWNAILRRCLDPKDKKFYLYGGRGITVCEKWKTFEGFFEDMGDQLEGKSIDRIDNNLGYFKENCRWTDQKTQSNNTRFNKKIKYKGKEIQTRLFYDKNNISNITYKGFLYRIKIGFDVDLALTIPSNYRRRK